MSAPTKTESTTTVRYVLIAALVATAFFVSYSFAVARNGGELDFGTDLGGGLAQAGPGTGGAGGAGCACCGNSGTGEVIEGQTAIEGDVQRISVDASAGYAPNLIRATAGVPLEITFSQGSGCMAQVMSRDLGFFEDLTTGAKTIKLPALEAGEYGFSCGMEMVFGTIVVE
ncbi:MAG: cupredoxin domain-containing protein [Coriobacteriia bacterium]|nr:cupredoxin domain-containing protein [Coriobacteriia bacterium]